MTKIKPLDTVKNKSTRNLSTLFVDSSRTRRSTDKKRKNIYQDNKLDQLVLMIQTLQQKMENDMKEIKGE